MLKPLLVNEACYALLSAIISASAPLPAQDRPVQKEDPYPSGVRSQEVPASKTVIDVREIKSLKQAGNQEEVARLVLSADEASMSTDLLAANLIPHAHPYGVLPSGYPCPEWVDTIPDNVVDWVLVALLRGDPASPPLEPVAGRAAFLLSDGAIVDLDGATLHFPHVPAGSYYVVIGHRNHLPVMSAERLDFASEPVMYDLTAASSQAYGSDALAEIAPGKYGLYAGDADANGTIDGADSNLWWAPDVGRAGYLPADFDLNGQVQNTDKNLFWALNMGRTGQIP